MEQSKARSPISYFFVGDDVRVKTIKDSKTKGYDPKWSKEVYKVTFIKGNDYLVNDIKRKTYIFDILYLISNEKSFISSKKILKLVIFC